MTWAPGIEEYHRSPEIGSSMLSTFRESPGLFNGQWITKTIEPEKPRKSMIMGSLLHSHFAGEVIQVAEHHGKPVGNRNSAAFRACFKEHGYLACTGPEAEIILGATLALKAGATPYARLARWLLFECPGKREYSHRWKHPSGETCKVRFDSLPDPGEGLPGAEDSFADLKFINNCNLDAFRRNVENFGTFCQGALYSQGYVDLRGSWPVVSYVMIGNSPPHPILVATLSEAFIEMGVDQVQKDLNGIVKCRHTRRWFSEEELSDEVPDLAPSYWFLKRYEEGLSE